MPHEINELDWKSRLSLRKDRLSEHLMAFGNHANGGTLAFGIDNDGRLIGIDAETVAQVSNSLANLGRDTVDPPVAIDHAFVDYRGVPILLVHVPEQSTKPVHRRGKSIEDAWIRSGRTTRTASRQEVGAMLMNSSAPRWEELRASPLLDPAEIRSLLDLEAIAGLLQRPLQSDPDELCRWLIA